MATRKPPEADLRRVSGVLLSRTGVVIDPPALLGYVQLLSADKTGREPGYAGARVGARGRPPHLGWTAQGLVTQETVDTTLKTFSRKVSGLVVTPWLLEANRLFDAAQLKTMQTRAGKKNSPLSARFAQARRTLAEQTEKERRARAAHSAIAPESPYADFATTWLGGRRELVAGALGSRPFTVPLAKLGAIVKGAGGAEKWVQDALAPVVKVWRAHGPGVGNAALYLALRENPELSEWVEHRIGR